MNTLTLEEAAVFLKMHPEEVRRRVKLGRLPGAKVGRRWVFLDLDLADYLRSLYQQAVTPKRIQLSEEQSECRSIKEAKRGGSMWCRPAENEYAALLGLTAKS